jgi:hypothetical protein
MVDAARIFVLAFDEIDVWINNAMATVYAPASPRAITPTFQPRRPNAVATARPTPALPPVTTTVRTLCAAMFVEIRAAGGEALGVIADVADAEAMVDAARIFVLAFDARTPSPRLARPRRSLRSPPRCGLSVLPCSSS